jgi:hypothetical protein
MQNAHFRQREGAFCQMLMQYANVLRIEAVEMADGLSAPKRLGICQMRLPG